MRMISWGKCAPLKLTAIVALLSRHSASQGESIPQITSHENLRHNQKPQIEAHLQGAIGYPSLAFQQGDDLFNNVVKGHDDSSNASKSALASCKSAVSNPSVNQWYTGASRSWASWRLPCCCHSRARLVAILNSKDLACWLRARSRAWRKQDSASARLSACC